MEKLNTFCIGLGYFCIILGLVTNIVLLIVKIKMRKDYSFFCAMRETEKEVGSFDFLSIIAALLSIMGMLALSVLLLRG